MRTITFTAQREQLELIDSLVQSGEYKNENEAINAALKLLEGQSNDRLQRLRSLVDEGLSSGPSEAVDENNFLQECQKA